MNPVVLWIANGNAFFVGMAFVTGALLLIKRLESPSSLGRALLRIAMVIGVGLVFASSTPLPAWVSACWIGLWLVSWFGITLRRSSLFWTTGSTIFFIFSGALCLMEIRTRESPAIPISQNQEIYVIGDSISAGMGTAEKNWPEILGKRGKLQVTNLAQPGATAASALLQLNGSIKPNSLILLEIGGNDLLGGSSSVQFHKHLEKLLQSIPPGNRIAMFELPLLPFNQGYGQAQRSLAKKYHVLLIPKKVLAAVIAGDGNTLDGLHLSQKGHDALAATVLGFLAIDRF